jgi:hypothetical protein
VVIDHNRSLIDKQRLQRRGRGPQRVSIVTIALDKVVEHAQLNRDDWLTVTLVSTQRGIAATKLLAADARGY